jgi:predicted rRNA methylase YqxC with S4 and FtsJ domains
MTATITEPGATSVLELLLDAGIREDRARSHLAEGRVYVDDRKVTDPSSMVPGSAHIRLRDYLPD